MRRKLFFACLMVVAVAFTGCEDYDDSEIKSDINSAEERLDALEDWQMTAEEQIAALEAITNALDGTDYITDVEEIKDGSTVVGYEITFAEYGVIKITNGVNGEAGEDGSSGSDGDSMFQSVKVEDGYLVVVLTGTTGEIKLPIAGNIEVVDASYDNGVLVVSSIANSFIVEVNLSDYSGVYAELSSGSEFVTRAVTGLSVTKLEDDKYKVDLTDGILDDEGVVRFIVVLTSGDEIVQSIPYKISLTPLSETAKAENAFVIDINTSDGLFQAGATYVSVVLGDDAAGSKVATTKERFAFDGNQSVEAIVDGLVANNLGSDGANEHQWGYSVEKIDATTIMIAPLYEEMILDDDILVFNLVGLGGHTPATPTETRLMLTDDQMAMNSFQVNINTSDGQFQSGATYVSVVLGDDAGGDKVVTTKDRIEFEGSQSVEQIIDGFVANNPGSAEANEHQWGYKAEEVDATTVKITPIYKEGIVPEVITTYNLVGLGGHTPSQPTDTTIHRD